MAVGDFVEALETVAAIGDVGERLNALTAVNLSGRNIEPEVYGRILRMIDADQLNLFGTWGLRYYYRRSRRARGSTPF